MNNIEIKQLNCQEAKAAIHFIAGEMSRGPIVCLLQEPYMYRGRIPGLPKGYKTFYSTDNARAAIVAHESVDLNFCPGLSDRDMSVCLMKNKEGKNSLLVSCYLDILLDPISEKLVMIRNKLANS